MCPWRTAKLCTHQTLPWLAAVHSASESRSPQVFLQFELILLPVLERDRHSSTTRKPHWQCWDLCQGIQLTSKDNKILAHASKLHTIVMYWDQHHEWVWTAGTPLEFSWAFVGPYTVDHCSNSLTLLWSLAWCRDFMTLKRDKTSKRLKFTLQSQFQSNYGCLDNSRYSHGISCVFSIWCHSALRNISRLQWWSSTTTWWERAWRIRCGTLAKMLEPTSNRTTPWDSEDLCQYVPIFAGNLKHFEVPICATYIPILLVTSEDLLPYLWHTDPHGNPADPWVWGPKVTMEDFPSCPVAILQIYRYISWHTHTYTYIYINK